MSTKHSIVLLPDSQGQYNMTGEAVRADGWYGFYGGFHTVSISIQNFRGRIHIEASLANDPTDDDWFPIHLTATSPYLEYNYGPCDANLTAGDNMHIPSGNSEILSYNFEANIMWLRARIERDYLGPEPDDVDKTGYFGVVREILLNH